MLYWGAAELPPSKRLFEFSSCGMSMKGIAEFFPGRTMSVPRLKAIQFISQTPNRIFFREISLLSRSDSTSS